MIAGTTPSYPAYTRIAKTVAAGALLASLATATALGANGGTLAAFEPQIASVQCKTGCAGFDVARPGSWIQVDGAHLDAVVVVAFLGGQGADDDARTRPRYASERRFYAQVPAAARSGPVGVVNDAGLSDTSSDAIAVYRPGEPVPGGGSVAARVASRYIFFAGRQRARLQFLLSGSAPQRLRIELVHLASQRVVRSWRTGMVAPGRVRTLDWDGLATRGVPPDGRYEFRVFAQTTNPTSSGGAVAAQARPSAGDTFYFLRHMFPIRGSHSYGTAINRFGDDRGDHMHQGHDVFASCGTPIVAARGGRVRGTGYGGAAGNYIVIDGAGNNVDYVYYHLLRTPLAHTGEVVYTGELIGFVGETGNAVGCHVHFELWNGPWWGGGRAFDPLPSLLAWDRRT